MAGLANARSLLSARTSSLDFRLASRSFSREVETEARGQNEVVGLGANGRIGDVHIGHRGLPAEERLDLR